jgi:hypothetical protein
LFLLSAFAGSLYGQATGQSLLGLVSDATGAVVPGATITITNVATGVESRTTSNETGNYIFPTIQVGNYDLKCETQGFRTELVSNLRVETNARVRQNFALQVGEVTETVEVSAAAVTLNTENAVVGHVIENKRIIELPLNGRNIVQLAVLVAGVQFGSRSGLADGLQGQVMTGQTYSVSANGQREIYQVVNLDGVDAKDPRVHVAPFVPSIEAIEEFKIETNAYDAAVGFGGGAVTNITMKSGTNEFHGTLFEFLRNDKFDAEEYFLNFENPAGTPRKSKNHRRRNQYGVFAGGPIVKNKTFWAANWESRRERIGETSEAFFPHDSFRGGDFSELLSGTINPATGSLSRRPIVVYDPFTATPFPNNVIPSDRLHPGIVNNVLDFLPRAKFRSLDPLDITDKGAFVRTIDPNVYFVRGDHYFSDKDRIFGRFAYDRSQAVGASINPNFFNTQQTRAQNLATQWIHTFNSNMVNELRVGFNRAAYENFFPRQNTDFDSDSLGIGEFRVAGDGNREFTELEKGFPPLGFTIGDSPGEHNQLDTYQFGDHLSWIRGSHNLKMGGEYYYVTIERAAANVPNGSIGFGANECGYAFACFMLGLPNNTSTAEGWPFTFPRAGRQGYYIHDDWKVNSKLTMNLGLRFDYIGQPRDIEGLWRTIDLPGQVFENGRGRGYVDPATGQTIPTFFPEFVDERGGVKLWKQHVEFFMPRVGIAYRPTEKWVVRLGGGWFDNINHQNTWTILNLNPPKSGTELFQSVTDPAGSLDVVGADGATYATQIRQYRPGSNVLTLNDPFLRNVPGAASIPRPVRTLAASPEYRDSNVWKWNAGIQRELPFNTALKIEYVGSKGTHITNAIHNFNDPRPSSNSDTQSRRPYPRFFDPAQPEKGVQALAIIRYLDSYGESFHHGAQITLDKRYSSGLSYGIAYTYSKSHGDGEAGGNELLTAQDPYDRRGSRGRFRFDQTHNFVAHYVWELPGRNMSGPLKHIIGGWQSNGIVSIRSGFPFAITQGGGDLNLIDTVFLRPDLVGQAELENPTRKLWYNPQAFQRVTCNLPARQDLCHFGNLGYQPFQSPSQRNLDFSMFKNFYFGERYSLQFRSEFFNALNTPYFGQPNGIGFSTTNSLVPDAARMGEVRSTRTPPRIIQFGLKFFW